MYLKTMRPTYQGADMTDKISMLIAYTEELGDELAFRLESLKNEVNGIKKIIYSQGDETNDGA